MTLGCDAVVHTSCARSAAMSDTPMIARHMTQVGSCPALGHAGPLLASSGLELGACCCQSAASEKKVILALCMHCPCVSGQTASPQLLMPCLGPDRDKSKPARASAPPLPASQIAVMTAPSNARLSAPQSNQSGAGPTLSAVLMGAPLPNRCVCTALAHCC